MKKIKFYSLIDYLLIRDQAIYQKEYQASSIVKSIGITTTKEYRDKKQEELLILQLDTLDYLRHNFKEKLTTPELLELYETFGILRIKLWDNEFPPKNAYKFLEYYLKWGGLL